MLSTLTRKSLYTLLSFTLVFITGVTRADDTEIYFTGAAAEVIRPNVLFILDTSGSMVQRVPEAGYQSRLQVMKDAAKQVIRDVEDINVGLMRFIHDTSGGSVLFPITNIEDNVFNVVGETSSPTIIDYVSSITDGNNDAEENLADNSVSISGTVLDFLEVGGTPANTTDFTSAIDNNNRDGSECTGDYFCRHYRLAGDGAMILSGFLDLQYYHGSNGFSIALRFGSVNIKQNTLIEHAYVDLYVDRYQNAATSAIIYGEDADDSSGLSTSTHNISSRTSTSATVTWTGIPAAGRRTKVITPDLKNILQEIVSRGCNNPPVADPDPNATGPGGDVEGCTFRGNSVLIVIKSTQGRRVFFSHDTNPSFRPKLRMETSGTTAVPGTRQRIGLRFENIRIPRGTTITDASLVFTPSADCQHRITPTGVGLATKECNDHIWGISAEDADDSTVFTSTANDLTNRRKTRAVASWDVPDWISGTAIEITNNNAAPLTAVVQEVINRPGWCGGNALTFLIDTAINPNRTREAESYESSAADAVRFKYSYSVNGSGGCMETEETAQSSMSSDDAEQYGSVVNTTDTDLDIGYDSAQASDQTIGLRFQNIDIPQGATITEAFLKFYAHGTSTGRASFTIKGIDEDSPVTFSATTNDISSRATTTASVAWVPDPWTISGMIYQSDDIKTIVQEIVNRSGWISGNKMGFVIESGAGTRIAESFNTNAAHGPRLHVTYSDTLAAPFKSVRESLIETVDDLTAAGGTPILGAMYEAARYWRGESMQYGDTRYGNRKARISHPASYCTAPGACRGANENSGGATPTDDFGVYTPAACDVSTNPNSPECTLRVIEHDSNSNKAKYISPFSSTCSNNYQILLTDGQSNSRRDGIPDIVGMINKSRCYRDNNSFKPSGDDFKRYHPSESCAVDLAEHMATVDQSTSSIGENLANDQHVKTYTVGFNLRRSSQFMEDIANLGQGQYFEATTAGQLVDVFTTILSDVKNDPTSFASPSLAINAFNRLLSRNEVYFGLFTPQLSQSWLGNVKKYSICINSGGIDGDITTTGDNCTLGEILDTNNVPAIDIDNKFKDTAQSAWSATVDGRTTTQGGAGAEITDFTAQILYTDKNNAGPATSGTLLSDAGFKLTGDASLGLISRIRPGSTTWDASNLLALRDSICPTPSTVSNSQCEDRMHWLLGKRIITDIGSDISTNQRWSVNDVLHSSPTVITYGGSDSDGDGDIDVFFDKVIYGTNDGMLHFVNGATGAEEWRYLPSEFWSQQQTQYLNAEGTHLYGLDVTPTIWSVDNNKDGRIGPYSPDFDTVTAFIATRRGGNYIYALDLTANVVSTSSTVVPKFLWKIRGGTGFYTRLGQTWSQPQLTRISISDGSGGTTTKAVLIFGGGYDTALDDPNVYEPADNSNNDFMGNAIYITDPTDGSLIMSISGAGSFANTPAVSNIPVTDMHYSIPSRIRLMDSDGDGNTDRLYVGDTGGQVWRVDLDPTLSASSPANTVVGKLADVSTSALTTQRRFFEPPSVVQVRDTIYSDTEEYDYVLIGSGYRAHPLNAAVQNRFYAFRDRLIGTFSLPDADADGVSEVADAYPQATAAYADSDLIDVTTSALDANDNSHTAADGWFYDFTASGSSAEKVLSAPTTTAGTVVFTTFKPSAASLANPCIGGVGHASAYNLDILSANAGLDWDGDGDIDLADRKLALGGGIPSDVVPIFTEEGVIGIVGFEGGSSQLGVLSDLPRFRTYWYEES